MMRSTEKKRGILLFFLSGMLAACTDSGVQGGSSFGGSDDSPSDNAPVINTSGGGQTETTGGEDIPEEERSGAVQDRVCDRIVPDDVLPTIDCTSMPIGNEYDGCSAANTACGSVIGCLVERNEAIEGNVEGTYTGPVEGYQPPETLLPPMGTYMDGLATGWFGRGTGNTATGSCMLPPVRNIMAAALSSINFGEADWCGACAEVVGRSGQRVRIQIVDQCGGCPEHSLDLVAGDDSPYEMIDTTEPHATCEPYGGQPIRWRIVPCETTGGVVIHYMAGFNHYTPSIQIRNHRLPIAKVEDFVGGAWAEIPKQGINQYYLRSEDDGNPHPLVIRISAINGATIEGELPAFEAEMDYETNAQF